MCHVDKLMVVKCKCTRCGKVYELWAEYSNDEDAMFDLAHELLADMYNDGWETDYDLWYCPDCMKLWEM